MSYRFGKDKRLLRAAEYREVFSGASVRTGNQSFLLIARENDCDQHRLGLAVAKKHVRHATQRNRIKRCAREVFRHLPNSLPALDVVFLTRPGMAGQNTAQLHQELDRQLHRLCRRASADADREDRAQ
jgi:ribonuclease P protein component